MYLQLWLKTDFVLHYTLSFNATSWCCNPPAKPKEHYESHPSGKIRFQRKCRNTEEDLKLYIKLKFDNLEAMKMAYFSSAVFYTWCPQTQQQLQSQRWEIHKLMTSSKCCESPVLHLDLQKQHTFVRCVME